MLIRISKDLAFINKKLRLGLVFSDVKVEKTPQKLDEQINNAVKKVKSELENVKDLSKLEEISSVRETYKKLGLKSDYIGSNESLLKRIKKDNPLYKINNVVEVNNLISITSRRSVGSYDREKLNGEIVFRPGEENEEYIGTTKRQLKLKGLPLLADEVGAFGSPTSDSQRALISNTTKSIMTVIFSFDGEDNLEEQLKETSEYLKTYCSAENLHTFILNEEAVDIPKLDGNNDIVDIEE